MNPYIIDGRKLATEKEAILKQRVSEFVKNCHRKPKLVAVEISDDPGSVLYLKLKRKAAERVGIEFETVKGEAKRTVLRLRSGPSFTHIDGIFIQHPPGYDKEKWQKLVDQIPPEKDVDCLTSINLERIKEGKPRFLPATVKAIGYCLEEAFGAPKRTVLSERGPSLSRFLKDKRIVIFGRSPMVGLPLSWWLERLGAQVSVVHSQTENKEQKIKSEQADILISTVGKPGIITGDMVKDGAIVIDSGSPVGDIVFDEVSKKASAITPVPGGVGPLTVVSLMENLVEAAMLQYSHHADRGGS